MGIYKEYVKKALKLYLYYAVLHSSTKILYTLFMYAKKRYFLRNVPGDTSDVLGFKLLANLKRIYDYAGENNLKYGDKPLVKAHFGPSLEVTCNTPAGVKWLLNDEFDNFTKPKHGRDLGLDLIAEFVGFESVFSLAHGKHFAPESHKLWYSQRKIGAKVFTKSNFNNFMYETFRSKALKFVDVLNDAVKLGNQPVDMEKMFFCFTMDSIEKIFFGKETLSLTGDMSAYAKNFDEVQALLLRLWAGNLTIYLSQHLAPFPFNKLLYKTSRALSPEDKPFQEGIRKLRSYVGKYVNACRKDPDLKNRKDVLANFLNANNEVDDDTLIDVVLGFTIAGRDTTACALTWIFYELTQHPGIQDELYKELVTQLADAEEVNGIKMPSPSDLTPEKFPYLNGVLYEGLRLHPPVPIDGKIATRDVTFIDGKTCIPKGTVVNFNPYSQGRNPLYYKEPLKFDPTRWIPFKQPDLYNFPVFQAGPRLCLGKDMAFFEMRLLCSILLQKFRFELVPGQDISYSTMVTMSMTNDKEKTNLALLLKPSLR